MEVWINLEPMASSEIISGLTLSLLEIWCKNTLQETGSFRKLNGSEKNVESQR